MRRRSSGRSRLPDFWDKGRRNAGERNSPALYGDVDAEGAGKDLTIARADGTPSG